MATTTGKTWQVDEGPNDPTPRWIYEPRGSRGERLIVAKVYPDMDGRYLPTAKLIAAVPALLAAATRVSEEYKMIDGIGLPAITQLRAAIAKATGSSSPS